MKIQPKIILFQWLALIFLIHGIKRLYISSQYEKYNCILENLENPESDCWNKFNTTETIGDFISNGHHWNLYAFVFGIILIAIINWKKKIAIANSIIVFILTLLLFPIGFFRRGIINTLLNSFGGLFSDTLVVENLINGIIFTIIGGILIWKSRN